MTISVSAVFDRTTAFLQHRRTAALTLGAILFAPSFAQQVGAAAMAGGLAVPGGAWGVVSVLLSLVSLWAQLAVAAFVLAPDDGVGAAATVALRRLPLAIAIYLLLLVALVVLATPAALALTAAGWRMGDPAPPADLGIGTIAFAGGWAALVGLVGLWISARLLPLAGVVVGERRGFGSIARAVRLTRGLTAKLIGLLLLLAVVAIVATLATQTVVGSLARLLLGGDGAPAPADVATGAAVAALVAGLSLLVAAFEAMLFRTLVAPDGAVARA